MKRVFLDTNILLDYVLGREHGDDAEQLLHLIASHITSDRQNEGGVPKGAPRFVPPLLRISASTRKKRYDNFAVSELLTIFAAYETWT